MTQDAQLNTLELNLSLLTTIKEFNRFADSPLRRDPAKQRHYFWIKASLATNLQQTFNALRGLKVTCEEAPFLASAGENTF